MKKLTLENLKIINSFLNDLMSKNCKHVYLPTAPLTAQLWTSAFNKTTPSNFFFSWLSSSQWRYVHHQTSQIQRILKTETMEDCPTTKDLSFTFCSKNYSLDEKLICISFWLTEYICFIENICFFFFIIVLFSDPKIKIKQRASRLFRFN